jgi:ArsR family transcriptional regulator
MNRPLVPPDEIEAVARRFEVLGEPARLALLNALQKHGEQAVGTLVEATGLRQSNVSKHLRTMADEGLLVRRREGVHVYYALDDPTLGALCMLVAQRLGEEKRLQEESPEEGKE